MQMIDPRTGFNLLSTLKIEYEGQTYYKKWWFLINSWGGLIMGIIIGYLLGRMV